MFVFPDHGKPKLQNLPNLFATVAVFAFLHGCGNPKGEDGISTLTIKINAEITGSWEACVSGLSSNSIFGCVSDNDNSSYPLETGKAYLHLEGTYNYSLRQNGLNIYSGEYIIEVDMGKSGPDPRKGVDGKERSYTLEFKSADATLTVEEL